MQAVHSATPSHLRCYLVHCGLLWWTLNTFHAHSWGRLAFWFLSYLTCGRLLYWRSVCFGTIVLSAGCKSAAQWSGQVDALRRVVGARHVSTFQMRNRFLHIWFFLWKTPLHFSDFLASLDYGNGGKWGEASIGKGSEIVGMSQSQTITQFC